MQVTPFYGKLDGVEDPDHYISEVVEAAATTGYSAKVLFRKNLRERAVIWYSALDDDVKGNWNRLSSVFKQHFKKSGLFISLDERMGSLKQQAFETTEHYFERCKDIWALMSPGDDLYGDFGMRVAVGMMDGSFAERFIGSVESMGEELSFSNFLLFFKECVLLEGPALVSVLRHTFPFSKAALPHHRYNPSIKNNTHNRNNPPRDPVPRVPNERNLHQSAIPQPKHIDLTHDIKHQRKRHHTAPKIHHRRNLRRAELIAINQVRKNRRRHNLQPERRDPDPGYRSRPVRLVLQTEALEDYPGWKEEGAGPGRV